MKALNSRTILLGLLIQFFIGTCLPTCQDGPYFDIIAFHKLDAENPIQVTSVQEFTQCFLLCANSGPECLSLNVADEANKDGLYECELLRNTTKQFPELLMISRVYHHYTRRLPDMCAIPRCKNGGTCENWGNDYRCHCPQRFTGKQCENLSCNTAVALGMENGTIPDSSITASSEMDGYEATKARLHKKAEWTAASTDSNPWIQIDLGNITKVMHIATQGEHTLDEYIQSYTLKHGLDSSDLVDYQGGKVFTGNTDRSTVVKQALQPVILARYIKVLPKQWNNRASLRLEIYGCR